MTSFKTVFAAARDTEAYWTGRVKFQVAACLQDLLAKTEWTQDKLAEKVGVKPPQVSRALSGGNNTTLESLVKLSFAMGYVPHVTFVPVTSKAEVFKPAFTMNAQVKKRSVADVYSFDAFTAALPDLLAGDWNTTVSSNDQRFRLAA